jgi:hypothetical protein
MRRWMLGVLGLLLLLGPGPVPACSLCPGLIKEQNTLGEEMEKARLVLYGKVLQSTLDPGLGKNPGMGRSEFQIDRILRDDPFLTNKKAVVLERYVPVLNPKDPPRFLVFCDVFRDRLDPYLGRPVKSDTVVDYLEGAFPLRTKKDIKDRLQTLLYYFKFFDHPDETIANDAFREFAKASDQEVHMVARYLAPDKIRTMMENPKTTPEYLGLLGFLLGNCGRERDADFLRTLTLRSESTQNSFDGLLAGYLALKPREGWEMLRAYIADPKKPFPVRFSAICALRFCYSLKPQEYKQDTLRCLEGMVQDGDVADMAIEDLRKWKLWDLTTTVLAQHGKKSHATPITRRAIVRYALCCPLPEARQFVDRVRQQDLELVREIETGLDLEKGQ